MKNKTVLVLSLAASALFSSVGDHEKALVQSVLKATTIEKVRRSPVEGFYEAYLPNGQIIYINPFTSLMLFGEVYTAAGTNLTAGVRSQWREELDKRRLDAISLDDVRDVSLSIDFNGGDKDYTIVMFTDPQCPYCKRAEGFLAEKSASVEYVYYVAVKSHRAAPGMIETILASDDPERVIKSYVKGDAVESLSTDAAKERLRAMEAFAVKNQIQGTPNFIVFDRNGTAIEHIQGADLEKLAEFVE